MTPLLTERDLTAEERQAIDDEPRPGVWLQAVPGNSLLAGDAHTLAQDETDELIFWELCGAEANRQGELLDIWRPSFCTMTNGATCMAEQRGGIHSDPLVRLLAYRAWGDRDRAHDLVKLRASIDLICNINRVSRYKVVNDMRSIGGALPSHLDRFLECMVRDEQRAVQHRLYG